MEKTNRLGGADGVRALACLLVMGHHAAQRLSLPDQAPWVQDLQLWVLSGSSGVALFFILSGFLLATPFWRAWGDGAPRPSLATFALRRWARIAPAFWFNLVLTFFLALEFAPGARYGLERLIAGLTFTAEFRWQTFFPVELNGPLWSIGFEVFSYTLLGLGAWLWFRLPIKRTWAVGLGFWTLVFVLAVAGHQLWALWGQTGPAMKGWEYGMVGGAKSWWPQYSPAVFFAMFCLGILAAGAADRRLRSDRPARWWAEAGALAAVVAGALVLYLVRQAPEFSLSFPPSPYWFPFFPFLTAVVLALAPGTRIAARILDNPPARLVALLSFGLYLWHYLLLELANRLLWPDLHYFGVKDLATWAWQIGAVYLAAGVLAAASWWGFEKPIVIWSQKRGAKA